METGTYFSTESFFMVSMKSCIMAIRLHTSIARAGFSSIAVSTNVIGEPPFGFKWRRRAYPTWWESSSRRSRRRRAAVGGALFRAGYPAPPRHSQLWGIPELVIGDATMAPHLSTTSAAP
jgi:hypothetical protein